MKLQNIARKAHGAKRCAVPYVHVYTDFMVHFNDLMNYSNRYKFSYRSNAIVHNLYAVHVD